MSATGRGVGPDRVLFVTPRRAGSGVTLSVGRDALHKENVLQVIFDVDAWDEAKAHDYLMTHHHQEYLAARRAGGDSDS